MTGSLTTEDRQERSLLADLRLAAGLSQEELAEAAGMGVRTIRDIERGATAQPRRDTRWRLADALGLSDDVRRRFEAYYGDANVHQEAVAGTVPRQLPPDVREFVGRDAELDRLDDLLFAAAPSDAQLIAVLAGMGGMGKSALACRWAHRHSDRFPDGRLWVDLRGFDVERPMDTAAALANLLRALGVDGSAIPPTLEERAATYRSLVADRRLLIVLDNARDAAQVRPLLPGSSACVTIVTSRDSLAGIVARHGAVRVDLEGLPLSDATALLDRLLGDRDDRDPETIRTIAQQCVRHPLSLRIAAERAVAIPHQRLSDLAAELSDAQRRLDLLDAGEPLSAVRSVLLWSYRQLDAATARIFRRLGLLPSKDFDLLAVAVTTDTTTDAARRVLDRLRRAYLVHETDRGRFAMHDLLRSLAAERLDVDETEAERDAARVRMFDYYRHAAFVAIAQYAPQHRHRLPDVADPGLPTPDIPDLAAAFAWLERERENLLAVAHHAADLGSPAHLVELSSIIFRYLSDGAYDQEAEVLFDRASRLAEGAARARALNHLGITYWDTGRFPRAIATFDEALAACHASGDRATEGAVLGNLGGVYERIGRYPDAIARHEEALTIAREVGNRDGEGRAHNNLGTAYYALGKYPDSLTHHRRSLEIARAEDDRISECRTVGNLAEVYERLGEVDQALDHHRRSLAMSRDLGNRNAESNALSQLGVAYAQLGQPEDALELLHAALRIARELGRAKREIHILNNLGEVSRTLGDAATALDRHRDALALATASGEEHERARALDGLGASHRDLGRPDLGIEPWREALDAFDRLGAPEAAQVRERLRTAVETCR